MVELQPHDQPALANSDEEIRVVRPDLVETSPKPRSDLAAVLLRPSSRADIDNLRQAPRYLPDNIYDAMDNFRNSDWTTKLLGEDVKARYADLKQASADRCPRHLGTFVKAPEVQYHHEVYNQFLWNMF